MYRIIVEIGFEVLEKATLYLHQTVKPLDDLAVKTIDYLLIPTDFTSTFYSGDTILPGRTVCNMLTLPIEAHGSHFNFFK